MQKVPLGSMGVSPHRISDFLNELRYLLGNRSVSPRTILYVNAHVYNLACKNEALLKALNECRINAADGMAIVWAARMLGHRFPERCNMTEAFRAFLGAQMPSSRAILIGCSEQDATAAAEQINRDSKHCRVVKAYSGFLSRSEYEKVFSEHQDIDFVFLGMGTPHSEFLAQAATGICRTSIVWAIGGGTIRIYAGNMKEAPEVWRRLGLQWLHRLLSEPASLWRRYLVGNPLFVYHVLQSVLRSKRYGA